MTPVVSVLLAATVPAPFTTTGLDATIVSILAQTFDAVELIVAGPAECQSTVANYQVAGGRAVTFLMAGAGKSRGELLKLASENARGSFLCWAWPGDIFAPSKIRRQLHALACDPHAGAVSCALNADRGLSGTTIESLYYEDFDARSILVAGNCFEAVGGFDSRFAFFPELDLATRLCSIAAFTHVAEVLQHCERELFLECDEDTLTVWRGFAASASEASLSVLGQIDSVLSRRAGLPPPFLCRAIGRECTSSDLTVAVASCDCDTLDFKTLCLRLGFPNAACAYEFTSLSNLRAESEYLVLIDPARMPQRGVLAAQLLRLISDTMDACLPIPDPLVYSASIAKDDPPSSLIPGTVFRRSVLEAALQSNPKSEERFWAAFERHGRIGALRPEPVPRPSQETAVREAAPPGHFNLLNGLVDSAWYFATYPEIGESQTSARDHYLDFGWVEKRNPNAWFHTEWYLERNPEVIFSGVSPLEHFILTGAAEGCWPSAIFDVGWYSHRYLQAEVPTARALEHFIAAGLAKGAVPHPQWAELDPLDQVVPSTLESPVEPAVERSELLLSLIDAEWYRNVPPLDAAAHYLEQGWKEGRDPNPWFDSSWYLKQNSDAKSQQTSPLEHFVSKGASRGERPHPLFDIVWYADQHLNEVSSYADAFRHFLVKGIRSGFVPHPAIATEAMLLTLVDLPVTQRTPWMKRWIQFALDADKSEIVLDAGDDAYWPASFAAQFPRDRTAVLVIGDGMETETSATEYNVTGVLEEDGSLRVLPPSPSHGVSVRFLLPPQIELLKQLLIELRCRRVAVGSIRTAGNAMLRSIRRAGVPVYLTARLPPCEESGGTARPTQPEQESARVG